MSDDQQKKLLKTEEARQEQMGQGKCRTGKRKN